MQRILKYGPNASLLGPPSFPLLPYSFRAPALWMPFYCRPRILALSAWNVLATAGVHVGGGGGAGGGGRVEWAHRGGLDNHVLVSAGHGNSWNYVLFCVV